MICGSASCVALVVQRVVTRRSVMVMIRPLFLHKTEEFALNAMSLSGSKFRLAAKSNGVRVARIFGIGLISGPKGWTTKCTKCREHQNAKYAEKRGTQLDGRVKNSNNAKRRKRIDSRVAEQEAARELLSLHSPRTYEALDQLGLDINEDVLPFPPSIGDEASV